MKILETKAFWRAVGVALLVATIWLFAKHTLVAFILTGIVAVIAITAIIITVSLFNKQAVEHEKLDDELLEEFEDWSHHDAKQNR